MTKKEETKKMCNDCKEIFDKTPDNFFIHRHKRSNKDKGEYILESFSSYCKSCDRERQNKIYAKNRCKYNEARRIKFKEDPNYREHVKLGKRISSRKNLEQKMIGRAKTRSIKKGYEFNITREDIVIPEYCPLLGLKLESGSKGKYSMSPSIDRIDPSKGYVKGNIWVISTKANTMKSDATQEQLITFAKNILTKMI